MVYAFPSSDGILKYWAAAPLPSLVSYSRAVELPGGVGLPHPSSMQFDFKRGPGSPSLVVSLKTTKSLGLGVRTRLDLVSP